MCANLENDDLLSCQNYIYNPTHQCKWKGFGAISLDLIKSRMQPVKVCGRAIDMPHSINNLLSMQLVQLLFPPFV